MDKLQNEKKNKSEWWLWALVLASYPILFYFSREEGNTREYSHEKAWLSVLIFGMMISTYSALANIIKSLIDKTEKLNPWNLTLKAIAIASFLIISINYYGKKGLILAAIPISITVYITIVKSISLLWKKLTD